MIGVNVKLKESYQCICKMIYLKRNLLPVKYLRKSIEKIEVLEQKINKTHSAFSTLKLISATIGISMVINISIQLILSRLF